MRVNGAGFLFSVIPLLHSTLYTRQRQAPGIEDLQSDPYLGDWAVDEVGDGPDEGVHAVWGDFV